MSGYNKILTTINSSTTNYTNLVDESVIVIDTSNNRIGINTINPTHSIHISGGSIKANNALLDDLSINNNLSISGKLDVSNIVSDLIPKTDLSYNLGTTNNRWNEIHAKDLYVSNNSIYMGNKKIFYVDDSNNLVIDNSGGGIILNKSTSLNENASFTSSSVTFDSANLNGGYIYGTKVGTKYDDGIQQINRAEAYFSYIDVSGSDSSFNNNVYINNSLTVNNDLIVKSDVSFLSDLEVSENLLVQGDASFNKNVKISENLVVNNDVSFLSDLKVDGNLVVNNDVSFLSDLEVDGNLVVNNDVSFLSDLEVSGNLVVNNIHYDNKITTGVRGDNTYYTIFEIQAGNQYRRTWKHKIHAENQYGTVDGGNYSKYAIICDDNAPGNSNMFEVSGFDNIIFNTRDKTSGRGIYMHGYLHILYGYTGSDDRIKHNEVNILNGLNIIRKLNPKKYQKTYEMYAENYNGEISGSWFWEAGLIAQEILKIDDLSFCVTGGNYYDKNNNLIESIYYLNYNSIFNYNIAATKELDLIVQEQQEEINNLKTELTNIKSELATIKSLLNI